MKKYYIYIGIVAVAAGGFLLVSWRNKVARTAADFINIHEVGSNQGFDNSVFQSMMEQQGWTSGEEWCAYLVKTVYVQAFPNRASKISDVLSGSSQQTLLNAKNSNVFDVITSGKPKAGDIVIWRNVNDPSHGHEGIVQGKSGSQYNVVEGNTSFDDASSGQGVTIHKHDLVIGQVEGDLQVMAFLRLKLF